MLQIDRLVALAKEKGVSKSHLSALVGRGSYYIRDLAKSGTQPPTTRISSSYS